MWTYALVSAGGVIIGIIADRLISHFINKKNNMYEETLIKTFGDISYISVFSAKDLYDWSASRKDQLEKGFKIVALMANAKSLEKINVKFDKNGTSRNTIIMAVVDLNNEDKPVVDSLLVRFGSLDDKISNEFKKGDGIIVVEK